MPEPALDPAIMTFYTTRYDEEARLTGTAHGRLELLRTRELLTRFLPPPPAAVLDVGGGTGVHARWLTGAGYAVRLVDPVPRHIAAAQLDGVVAFLGDARALPEDDDTADATLLLGPLYHLTDADDRATALREALRVTRPGGVVIVAAISRYAWLLEEAASGGLADADIAGIDLTTGVNVDDPDGFTTAYFHRPAELTDELTAAGLVDVQVLGVEGPSAPALDAANPASWAGLLPSAVRAARALESDPALINASPHLLGVGWLLPAWTDEAVHVSAADPAWAEQGAGQGRALDHALARWLVAPVEHIGSTSVPGLAAKPILDLQAAVADLCCAPEVAAALAPAGWHWVPPVLDARPWRRFFVLVAGDRRVAHLHLLAGTGGRWQRQLAFRDALRADPDLADRYSSRKVALAQQYGQDREAYTSAKSAFVRAVGDVCAPAGVRQCRGEVPPDQVRGRYRGVSVDGSARARCRVPSLQAGGLHQPPDPLVGQVVAQGRAGHPELGAHE